MARQGLGASQCVTRGGRHPYAWLGESEVRLIGVRTRTKSPAIKRNLTFRPETRILEIQHLAQCAACAFAPTTRWEFNQDNGFARTDEVRQH